MHLFYIEETDPLDRHRAEIIKLCMRAEVLEQRAAALPPGSERDAVVDSQIENIKKATSHPGAIPRNAYFNQS